MLKSRTEACKFLHLFCIFSTISILFSVLYYRKNGTKNITNNGCTVDLLTRHSNMIKFRTGVKLEDGNDCLDDCSIKDHFQGASANMLVLHSSQN